MPPKGWVFSISESWKILIGHEKVMEKSLNFIAQFLYEPCYLFVQCMCRNNVRLYFKYFAKFIYNKL